MPLPHACLLLLTACTLLGAAEPTPPKAKPAAPTAFLTVEAAGPDFLLQGEFETKGLGADIIALGGDQYRLVLFKGPTRCRLGWLGQDRDGGQPQGYPSHVRDQGG